MYIYIIFIYLYIYIINYILYIICSYIHTHTHTHTHTHAHTHLVAFFITEFRVTQVHLPHFSEIFQGCNVIFQGHVYNIHHL